MNQKRIYYLVVFLLACIAPCFACNADIKVSNDKVLTSSNLVVYGYINDCSSENLNPDTLRLELVKDGMVVSKQYVDFLPHDGNSYAFSSGSFVSDLTAPSALGRYYLRLLCDNTRIGDSVSIEVVSSLNSLYLRAVDNYYDDSNIYIKSRIQNLFSYPVQVNYSVCAKNCITKSIILQPYEIFYTDGISKFTKSSLGIDKGQFPVVVTAEANDSSSSSPYYFLVQYDGYKGNEKYYSTDFIFNDYTTDYGWKKTFYFTVKNTGLKSWFNVSLKGWLVENGFVNFTEQQFVLNNTESKDIAFELELPVWAVVLNPSIRVIAERNNELILNKTIEVKITSGAGDAVNIDVELNKNKFVSGETAGAEVLIYNLGSNAKEIYLRHNVFDQNYESAAPISILPNSHVSREINFETVGKVGNYSLKVDAVDSTRKVTSVKNFEVIPAVSNFSFYGVHPLLASGTNGSTLNYTLVVKNEGNVNNTFNFSVSNLDTTELKPGESKTFFINVSVNSSETAGIHEFTVSACSVLFNDCKTVTLKKSVNAFGDLKAEILNNSVILYNNMNNDSLFTVTNIYGYSKVFALSPFSSEKIDFSSMKSNMSYGTYNVTFEIFSGETPVYAGEMTFELKQPDNFKPSEKNNKFFFSKTIQIYTAVFLLCILATVSFLKHYSQKSAYKYWR